VQQLASGLGLQQQQQQQQTRIVQQLVGVAEVSFKESTRSSYLTLNPPRVRVQGLHGVLLRWRGVPAVKNVMQIALMQREPRQN
jgi:hypothetical protein